MRTVLRALAGFIVACVAAGLTTLLFVHTPAEVIGWISAPGAGERFPIFLSLWVSAAMQSFLFAALFALLAAIAGEWKSIRGWTYYALAGVIIAALGFTAQWLSEPTGQNWSVINGNYPLVAFLTTGFVGGFVYWLCAGKTAGRDPETPGGKSAPVARPQTSEPTEPKPVKTDAP